ncbi:MAG: exodeoxyribonuclease VII large subunit [Spirochaetaceae bacterium]|nr:MAG: exodeoxyribonuclease VII large subunit [Spirochaetaceae bacterium]
MCAVNSEVLTVTQLTTLLKSALESRFPALTLEGEVSNFRPSSTGHYYFTLKDESSMIQAVMFRNRAGRLDFQPEDGMLVRASGSISVYARRGTYQIICEQLELAGTGAILALLEKRKHALAAEGLFDQQRKKQLPPFPATVAVVTSPTGAAIRDIVNVLTRRNAGIALVVIPAPVQGETAAEKLAAAIARADRLRLGEVIIVGRGGGSLEDLLPFSDERVVRAIAACTTPVISAVGHEIDVALSDLAADMRAPTPSAAAELVSADRAELRRHVLQHGRDIIRAFSGRIERARFYVRQFSAAELERNLMTLLQPTLQRLDDAKEELARGIQQRLADSRHRLQLAHNRLQSVSPLAVLQRGFAVVSLQRDGELVRSVEQLTPQAEITIRVHDGAADARVVEKKADERI